jgi:hypothetical protein
MIARSIADVCEALTHAGQGRLHDGQTGRCGSTGPEGLNPLFKKNARLGPTLFLVLEKGECQEIGAKEGFVVTVTLTVNANRNGEAVSLALRNRFVTVAVDSPVLSSIKPKR